MSAAMLCHVTCELDHVTHPHIPYPVNLTETEMAGKPAAVSGFLHLSLIAYNLTLN